MVRKIALVLLILILLSSCSITPPESMVSKAPKSTVTPKNTDEISVDETAVPENYLVIKTNNIDGYDLDIFLSPGNWSGFLYKNYEINVMSSGDSYDEHMFNLKTSLMAGDTSFDIFTVNSTLTDIMPLLENGYFVDLNTNDRLSSEFPLMFDEIRQMINFKDKVFGFPLFPRSTFITLAWDKEKIAELGIEKLPNTWEELLVLNETLDNQPGTIMILDYNSWEINQNICIDLLYDNFELDKNYINFDLVDIRKAKSIYNALSNSNILYDQSDYYYGSYKRIDAIGNDYWYHEKQFLELYEYENIYLFEEDNTRYVGFGFLMVNPNSENVDLALEFISDIAILQKTSRDQFEMERGSTERDLYFNRIPLYPLYKDANVYENNEFSMYYPLEYTQEYLDMHGKAIKGIELFNNFNGFDECKDILQSYFDDEIIESEAKQQMQRIMDSASREYTLD